MKASCYRVSAETEVYCGMCSAPQAVNNKSTAEEMQEKIGNSFQPKQHTCCQSSVLLISRLLAAGTLDLSSHMCRYFDLASRQAHCVQRRHLPSNCALKFRLYCIVEGFEPFLHWRTRGCGRRVQHGLYKSRTQGVNYKPLPGILAQQCHVNTTF